MGQGGKIQKRVNVTPVFTGLPGRFPSLQLPTLAEC